MADTWNITCSVSPCVIQHEIVLPPFQLDVTEGAMVAVAIVGVWAIGWAFRMFVRSLSVTDAPVSQE